MVIKAENNIEREDIKALINCNSAKVKFMLYLLSITFILFLAFCLIVNNTNKYLGYCIAGILWCVVVYVYIFLLNPGLAYASFKKRYTKNAFVKYELTAKSIAITIDCENAQFNKRKNYRDMFRVYETQEYFFFYTKRNETYILKKSGIKQGTAEDISNLLMQEAGSKFIRKVKA